ncbi:MAG: hypothetical protein AABY83_03870, partial [Pseudomonadota bacterium]
NGIMKDIGNGSAGIANAVNNNGHVVGQLEISFNEGTGGSERRPFLWENGKITTLSGSPGAAMDINNKKQVVGSISIGETDGYPVHAFMWEKGKIKDLGTLGGNDSAGATRAFAINDLGQIVGCSVATEDGVEHPFLWEKGVMKDLGSGYDLGGCALDINNAGQVIGYFYKKNERFNTRDMESFLWENGNITPLTDSDFSVSKINTAGDILGTLNGAVAILKNGKYYTYKEIDGWEISSMYAIDFNDNWQMAAMGGRSGSQGVYGLRISLIENMPPVLKNLNSSGNSLPTKICTLQKDTQDCVDTGITKTQMHLTWDDEDADDNASISLYYYEDVSGAIVDVDVPGTLITDTVKENDANEYVWDIGESDVMQNGGQYAVYAVIDDGVHEPKKVYSEQMKQKLPWWGFCKAKNADKPYATQYSEEEQKQMGGCSRTGNDFIPEKVPPCVQTVLPTGEITACPAPIQPKQLLI